MLYCTAMVVGRGVELRVVRERVQGHLTVLKRAPCFQPCSHCLMSTWIRVQTVTKLHFQRNKEKGIEGKENS